MPRCGVAAVNALAFSTQDNAGAALAAALRVSVWQVRAAAAETLGRVERAAVVPALGDALADEYWQVRQKALLSLGKLKARAAVPVILPLLEHVLPSLRKEAAAALGEIADRRPLRPWRRAATMPTPTFARRSGGRSGDYRPRECDPTVGHGGLPDCVREPSPSALDKIATIVRNRKSFD